MIFFGARSSVFPAQQEFQTPCSHCGEDAHQGFGVLRYFHVFWVPMFPFSREVGLTCKHCKKTSTSSEVPEGLVQQIKDEVFTRGRVFRRAIGAIIVAIMVFNISVAMSQEREKDAALLAEPQVGDLYIVKLSEVVGGSVEGASYGICKVTELGDGTVSLQVGSQAFAMMTGATKAIQDKSVNSDDYFRGPLIPFTEGRLGELHAAHHIKDVVRR